MKYNCWCCDKDEAAEDYGFCTPCLNGGCPSEMTGSPCIKDGTSLESQVLELKTKLNELIYEFNTHTHEVRQGDDYTTKPYDRVKELP